MKNRLGKFKTGIAVASLLLIAGQAPANLIFDTNPSDLGTLTSGPLYNLAFGPAYGQLVYRNFSNASGGNAGVQIGLNGVNGTYGALTRAITLPWAQTTYNFTYTYNPKDATVSTTIGNYTDSSSLGTIASAVANEFQIVNRNTKSGDLILTLNTIYSVAKGGVFNNGVVTGGAVNFGQDGNGQTFHSGTSGNPIAFLDDPTLFNSGFTITGTLQVNSAPNSSNYGNNNSSLISFNLDNNPNVVASQPVTIGDYVWVDANGNGIQDNG
ncbi:MAG: hypothetical protein WCS94_19280, partial [Verrucomicrobiota bacterium]